MIGRRCTHGNMFSRPVLIARTLSFTGKIKQETRFELNCLGVFLSAKYCGGYSGGEPPLPIPNREVKPAIADGTAMQCGRVGSRLLLSGLRGRMSSEPVFYALFGRVLVGVVGDVVVLGSIVFEFFFEAFLS